MCVIKGTFGNSLEQVLNKLKYLNKLTFLVVSISEKTNPKSELIYLKTFESYYRIIDLWIFGMCV